MEKLHGTIQEKLDRFEKQPPGVIHDMVQKERAARAAIEEVLGQEKAQRTRHLSTLDEKVDSLHKSMSIFDSLLRKEIDERSKEYHRLWDAIDTHTHDLSTQVIGESIGYSPEPARVESTYRSYLTGTAPTVPAASQAWTSTQPVLYPEPVVASSIPPSVVRVPSPAVPLQSWPIQAK